MQLTSDAFQDGGTLPTDYTCKGKGISPPLTISDVPEGTASLALIMHDPDAIGGRDFLHWILWNIPPDTKTIPEGQVPAAANQGINDYPDASYGPACPPAGSGLHHYVFDLYALNTTLDLSAKATRKEVENAIAGHTLATARLVGTVQS
jgi:Raf kinase inhibitor-like YbhB/YbcL family protein